VEQAVKDKPDEIGPSVGCVIPPYDATGLDGGVGDARPLLVLAIAIAEERKVEHVLWLGGVAGVIVVQRACLCVVCSLLLSLGWEGEFPPGD
jgi:hypothetical protein